MYLSEPGLSCTMWDLVPWPGIKPRSPASGGWSLSRWTSREVPTTSLNLTLLFRWIVSLIKCQTLYKTSHSNKMPVSFVSSSQNNPNSLNLSSFFPPSVPSSFHPFISSFLFLWAFLNWTIFLFNQHLLTLKSFHEYTHTHTHTQRKVHIPIVNKYFLCKKNQKIQLNRTK